MSFTARFRQKSMTGSDLSFRPESKQWRSKSPFGPKMSGDLLIIILKGKALKSRGPNSTLCPRADNGVIVNGTRCEPQ